MAIHLVHPHIVRTFEYGSTNKGEHFMVMEFIDGVSFQFIRETRSARTAEKLELLAQAAEGMAALHAAGFIHHDINPRNFLVTRDQHVKLIDFGLSIPNRPPFCGPGNRTGTVQYMAPELLRREPIDDRIDIFAFGVMAFELLTERLPYDATTNAVLMLQRINVEPLDPAVVKPQLSEELCALLRQLTAKRREQRWAEMKTLPEALRNVPASERSDRQSTPSGTGSASLTSWLTGELRGAGNGAANGADDAWMVCVVVNRGSELQVWLALDQLADGRFRALPISRMR